jgi:beta-1,4-N-acetylglucosaminyltransferase
MFMLLEGLDPEVYNLRRYVISEGDDFSCQRALNFEARLATQADREEKAYGSFDYKIVPRARRIHQSLLTTPISAISTFLECLRMLTTSPTSKIKESASINTFGTYPDLILSNGPGTAFMLICAALTLRYLGLSGTKGRLRCMYVESWARVSRLSLTGKLLRLFGLCDRFLVQWPDLAVQNKRNKSLGEFVGPLVI